MISTFFKDYRYPIAIGLGSITALWVIRRSIDRSKINKLRKLAKERQEVRKKCVKKLEHKLEALQIEDNECLPEKWDEITGMKFQDLREKLQLGHLTAVEVLHAFQWKALEAHKRTNCVTSFFDEAEEAAKILDAKFKDKEIRPPLFGIPCSIKENIQVKGYTSTCGMASFLENPPAMKDAVLVQTLKELGAVPFCHTNLPQTMFSISSANPIYGTTTNPKDKARTSGGSSSGEGAIGALKGSAFGIGGDIGGSVRIPANWCGIYGMKPTSTRMPRTGCTPVMKGGAMITSSYGPLGRDVETLVTVLRNFWMAGSKSTARDPYTTPIQFRDDLYSGTKKLKIGFYSDHGYFEVTPACSRAIEIAKAHLKQLGHELIPWTPPNVEEVFMLHQAAVRIPDGGRYLWQALNADIREPLNAQYPHFRLAWMPVWFRHVLGFLLRGFRGYERLSLYLRSAPRSTAQSRDVNERITNYRASFTQSWLDSGLDCLICPVHACPAPPNEHPMQIFGASTYANLYNLLDYPAGTVPCTLVTVEDEEKTRNLYPKIPDPETLLVKSAFSNNSIGLPVGVQCVALPYQDELCLRLMKELEQALNFH